MQDKYDPAIDRTLKALNEARPPEGMEARIQQRLHYNAAQANSDSSSWHLAKNWWLGVLTGAAVATIVCALGWFGLRERTGHTAANNVPAGTHVDRVVNVVNHPAETPQAHPCPAPAVRRVAPHAEAPVLMRVAKDSPKATPAAKDELTRQERELVRLAQVANPRELSAMTSEARARADAQQAAAFKEFFTPPPPPPHDEGVNE